MEQLIDFHAPEVQAVLDTLLKDKSTGLLHHPGQHHLVVGQPELLGGDLRSIRHRLVHYRLQLFRRVGGPDDVFTGRFIF